MDVWELELLLEMRNENVEKILQMVDPVFLILLISNRRKGKGTD